MAAHAPPRHRYFDRTNAYGIPVRILTADIIPPERSALQELDQFLTLQETVHRVRQADPDFFADPSAGIEQVAITPDFHKGSGVPIGTVMRTRGFVCPQAPGKDVNCGMRLYTTNLREHRLHGRLDALESAIRHIYFEGGRQIPMGRSQREALLRDGLPGLIAASKAMPDQSLWRYFDRSRQERDLSSTNGGGCFPTDGVFGLQSYLGSDSLSYDAQIGSIGGGNHFVELQVVHQVKDRVTAYAWGLQEGQVVIMVHSGSVSIGHLTGGYFEEIVRKLYPPSLPEPSNKLFPLPAGERHQRHWKDFWRSLSNAANFAFGNRLFLGLMMQAALTETVGKTEMQLLYDTGHNMIWPEDSGRYLHRKGACPARSAEQLADTLFAYYGEPVLIPGSMGSSSFVLAGSGSADMLESASHGAGRSLSRGEASRSDDRLLREFLQRFRIVTPLDPKRQDVRARPDILRKWEEEVKKEAPWAYKDINAVIEAQTSAGVGRLVAELRPLLTAKG